VTRSRAFFNRSFFGLTSSRTSLSVTDPFSLLSSKYSICWASSTLFSPPFSPTCVVVVVVAMACGSMTAGERMKVHKPCREKADAELI
jgi:hypothetical protein